MAKTHRENELIPIFPHGSRRPVSNGGFQAENNCRGEQIAAHLDVQAAWTTTTGMADVPVPSARAVCEPFWGHGILQDLV